jgi:hypothetical protein
MSSEGKSKQSKLRRNVAWVDKPTPRCVLLPLLLLPLLRHLLSTCGMLVATGWQRRWCVGCRASAQQYQIEKAAEQGAKLAQEVHMKEATMDHQLFMMHA